jgi:ribosomal protein S18 acetylase RimI-like enzyme
MIAVQPLTQAEFEIFMALAAEDYAQHVAGHTGVPIEQARESTAHEIATILPQGRLTPNHFFCGARSVDTSKLVGYLWWNLDDAHEQAYLYQVFVLESCRRRGFGRAMLEYVCATLGAKGVRRITLSVFVQNRGAIALYETQGYRVMQLKMIKGL